MAIRLGSDPASTFYWSDQGSEQVSMVSQRLAVLGLVIEQPGYGYQIAARVEDRCAAWGWRPNGVYSGLDLLTRDGQIRPRGGKAALDANERRPPRIIYEATDQGRQCFSEWMNERSAIAPTRDELELKIQLATLETLPILIEQTQMQEDVCIGRMFGLRRGDCPPGPTKSLPVVAAILQRNREIKALECRIEWLQEARAAMLDVLEQAGRRP